MLRTPRVLLPLVLSMLGACAGTQPNSGVTGAVDEAAINKLYARIDADSSRFEAGLALARSGQGERARGEIQGSLDDLRSAATRCGQIKGCDNQRFFAAFDRLLRLNVDGLADQGGAGEIPEATTQQGEDSPIIAAMPELGRSITLLRGRELSEVIAMNGPVKVALEEWLTQYRPNLITAYVNYQYMRDRMSPEYHRADLPEAILFGMLAKESGGRVHAVSRSGAAGPLQFMYATGLRFGLTTVDGFDQRFDAALSARANAAYLNEQLKALNNNLELVLAAYNGGEGRMRRLAATTAQPSFWDPKIYFELSPETRDYVPMVLAAAWLYLHPERYNLKFPEIAGSIGHVTLSQPASLAELSVCLGQQGNSHDGWFRTLRNLNPEMDPQKAQPAGAKLSLPKILEKPYASHCVAGQWAQLANDLHSATIPAALAAAPAVRTTRNPATPSSYVVRKGDTLAAIARKNGCGSASVIAGANGIRPPHYAIKPGQTLNLSACSR